MLKLLQHKYPSFPVKMNASQAQTLVHHYAYVAEDYHEELRAMQNFDVLAARDVVVQLPFVEVGSSVFGVVVVVVVVV